MAKKKAALKAVPVKAPAKGRRGRKKGNDAYDGIVLAVPGPPRAGVVDRLTVLVLVMFLLLLAVGQLAA